MTSLRELADMTARTIALRMAAAICDDLIQIEVVSGRLTELPRHRLLAATLCRRRLVRLHARVADMTERYDVVLAAKARVYSAEPESITDADLPAEGDSA